MFIGLSFVFLVVQGFILSYSSSTVWAVLIRLWPIDFHIGAIATFTDPGRLKVLVVPFVPGSHSFSHISFFLKLCYWHFCDPTLARHMLAARSDYSFNFFAHFLALLGSETGRNLTLYKFSNRLAHYTISIPFPGFQIADTGVVLFGLGLPLEFALTPFLSSFLGVVLHY